MMTDRQMMVRRLREGGEFFAYLKERKEQSRQRGREAVRVALRAMNRTREAAECRAIVGRNWRLATGRDLLSYESVRRESGS